MCCRRAKLLTVSSFRLNSRNYNRGLSSSTTNLDNAFHLSSIRFEPQIEAAKSKSSQTATSVIANRSTGTLDLAGRKSGHNLEPTFEAVKQV